MNQEDLERQALAMKGETVIFPKAGDYAVKQPDGTVIMYAEQPYVQQQVQLIDILCSLTKAGKATWLRRRADREWLYCFVESEKITVELVEYADDDDNETPLDLKSVKPNTSFVLHYRDESLLYLAGLDNGEKLMRLISSIDISDDEEREMEHYKAWRKRLIDPLVSIDRDSL